MFSLSERKLLSVLSKCSNKNWLCKGFAISISLNLFSPQIHKIWYIIIVVRFEKNLVDGKLKKKF